MPSVPFVPGRPSRSERRVEQAIVAQERMAAAMQPERDERAARAEAVMDPTLPATTRLRVFVNEVGAALDAGGVLPARVVRQVETLTGAGLLGHAARLLQRQWRASLDPEGAATLDALVTPLLDAVDEPSEKWGTRLLVALLSSTGATSNQPHVAAVRLVVVAVLVHRWRSAWRARDGFPLGTDPPPLMPARVAALPYAPAAPPAAAPARGPLMPARLSARLIAGRAASYA